MGGGGGFTGYLWERDKLLVENVGGPARDAQIEVDLLFVVSDVMSLDTSIPPGQRLTDEQIAEICEWQYEHNCMPKMSSPYNDSETTRVATVDGSRIAGIVPVPAEWYYGVVDSSPEKKLVLEAAEIDGCRTIQRVLDHLDPELEKRSGLNPYHSGIYADVLRYVWIEYTDYQGNTCDECYAVSLYRSRRLEDREAEQLREDYDALEERAREYVRDEAIADGGPDPVTIFSGTVGEWKEYRSLRVLDGRVAPPLWQEYIDEYQPETELPDWPTAWSPDQAYELGGPLYFAMEVVPTLDSEDPGERRTTWNTIAQAVWAVAFAGMLFVFYLSEKEPSAQERLRAMARRQRK